MTKVDNLTSALEWKFTNGLTSYEDAMLFMEQRVADIHAGKAPELVWFLEHPPLYTAGTSAKSEDLLAADRFPIYDTGRGGQYTYHGPGQRVVYVMLDLTKRGRDVRKYVFKLEQWLIDTLAEFNVTAERREGRVGVWTTRSGDQGQTIEEKIGAIGVRVRKWVTFHGICLNVEPDLEHYGGIVPCGIAEHGVTSLVKLGRPVSMMDVDAVLKHKWKGIFGDEF